MNIPIKPKINIDRPVQARLLDTIKEGAQVVVHCVYMAAKKDDRIGISKSTFLYTKDLSYRSKLVHTENIAVYPRQMLVEWHTTINFTLIFKGLPPNCKLFHLIENTRGPGGFVAINIERNNSDTYLIILT